MSNGNDNKISDLVLQRSPSSNWYQTRTYTGIVEDETSAPVLEKAMMREILAEKRSARVNNRLPVVRHVLNELIPHASTLLAMRSAGNTSTTKRHTEVLNPDTTYIYSCNIFDNCADDQLFGLAFCADDSPFLAWLTFQTTTVNVRRKYYLTYVGASGTAAGNPTSSIVTDCCAPGESIEWGICSYEMCGFPRMRRTTPVRCDDRSNMRYCKSTQTMFLDGTPIIDDFFMDMMAVMETIHQDLECLVFDAEIDTEGFNGIKALATMEIPSCPWLQGTCIDYGGNDVNTGTGGESPVDFPDHQSALANWFGEGKMLMDLLEKVIELIIDCLGKMRETKGRVGRMDTNNRGDIIIVGGSSTLRCLRDMFLCWDHCTDKCYLQINVNKGEIATMKESNITQSIWGLGYLRFCGLNIHLMPHDRACMYPEGDSESGLGDIFILVGQVADLPILFGQMYDHTGTKAAQHEKSEVSDGGRVLIYSDGSPVCNTTTVQIQPRIVSEMPKLIWWIKNIPCGNIPSTRENFFTPKTVVTCTPIECGMNVY